MALWVCLEFALKCACVCMTLYLMVNFTATYTLHIVVPKIPLAMEGSMLGRKCNLVIRLYIEPHIIVGSYI